MPVTIGVDPHKASHIAAALDGHGQLLDQQRIPATLEGYQLLRQWAGRWPQRCWAVEGAHGVGRALAQWLVADGEQVVDVPAKLAARVRVLSSGHGRKSDPDDAVSVAMAARSAPGLRRVGVEDQAMVLHLLTKRREDLVAMRTQTINRLHRLLVDLVPGGARRNLTAKRAVALLDQVAPASAPGVIRHQLAQELIADVRQLDRRIADVEARIKTAVVECKTSLLELFGVGPVLAAKFFGEVGDIRRFPTKHHEGRQFVDERHVDALRSELDEAPHDLPTEHPRVSKGRGGEAPVHDHDAGAGCLQEDLRNTVPALVRRGRVEVPLDRLAAAGGGWRVDGA
jgi:transposase